MKLSTAIILFFIVLMVVQNQKECANGGRSSGTTYGGGGSWMGNSSGYINVGSLDGVARTIDPSYGRTHSTFHFTSPESWTPGMFPDNKASMLNVGSRPHITGIPSVPHTNTPPYQEVPRGFNV